MPPLHLGIYARQAGDALVLTLEGHLDAFTAGDAVAAFERYLKEQPPCLILDAGRLHFIDSRGVAALIGLARAARERGAALFLYQPTMPVRNILAATHLAPLFPLWERPLPPATPPTSEPQARRALARAG